MNKSKVLTEEVVSKIDAVIDALKKIPTETEAEKASIDARISVLEWLKSGKAGTVRVQGIEK